MLKLEQTGELHQNCLFVVLIIGSIIAGVTSLVTHAIMPYENLGNLVSLNKLAIKPSPFTVHHFWAAYKVSF